MSDASDYYIVGIGASAGGLEALETFFDHMPISTRYAFVIVQHLSPDYKSLMGELLTKHTEFAIYQAEDGMAVEPGAIYLIPRKRNMTMYKSRLFLTEQEQGLNLPIDIFLTSLAEDTGERAIAVILSGTGSDGTRGVRAVKEHGGLAIVQDPDSAKFNGMPRSAISTGIVDYVLPANRIPEELDKFVSGSIQLVDPDTRDLPGGSNELSKIFLLIRRRTGVDLSYYKESTIYRRIERRMGITQISTIQEYVSYLEENPAEVTTLFKEILIGVTKFFRDPEGFDVVYDRVLPTIFEDRPPTAPVRIWVAGCSTGEEAYSLAILVSEYCQEHSLSHEVKIFATDIDRTAIEFAGYGVYPESIAADASRSRMTKYFNRKGDSYQVKPAIREMVIFAYHNIFKDPPFRRIDLVSCRNLLIYLQPVLQKKVLSNFHFSLTPGGFLFLGSSESVGEYSRLFTSYDMKWKVFQMKPGSKPRQLPPETQERDWHPPARHRPIQRRSVAETRFERVDEHAYINLIDRFFPPSVLVTGNREVIHVFGDVSPFLRLPLGRMDLDVLKMARPEVSIALSTALQSAVKTGEEVVYNGVTAPNQVEAIQLIVAPVKASGDSRQYAILFKRDEDVIKQSGAGETFHLDESVQSRIESLESELQTTRENLQATIEELETSNEELQATNEELLSSNEELQSTNEELQSVNEELITVNSEYQKKIEELSELNDDMDNLLGAGDIGTIFLSEDLTIRKYTQAATDYFNIIKTDLGRKISDLSHDLEYDALLSDIEAVARTETPRQVEVRTTVGKWLLVKITPYRGSRPSPEGIVLSLIDITDRKDAETALVRQHEFMMQVLESNPSGIIMLDSGARVVFANAKGSELLGFPAGNEEEVSDIVYGGQELPVHDDTGSPLDVQTFLSTMDGRGSVDDMTHQVTRSDGSTVTVQITGSPILGDDGEIEGAVLNIIEADPRNAG